MMQGNISLDYSQEITYQLSPSKKVLCTAKFDATKVHSSCFKALYTLGEGLASTLTFEFVNPPKDDITFKSE